MKLAVGIASHLFIQVDYAIKMDNAITEVGIIKNNLEIWPDINPKALWINLSLKIPTGLLKEKAKVKMTADLKS